MKVGDLVKIITDEPPFLQRPSKGSIGLVVEVRDSNWLGTYYYVYINSVGWRFYKKDLEVISDGSG